MEKYQCHKVVQAGKISSMAWPGQIGASARLMFYIPMSAVDVAGVSPVAEDVGAVDVSGDWMMKHKPQVDGYYVLYEDGYASYSPPGPFEAGYSRLSEGVHIERVARVCHEANAAYCLALGDYSQVSWSAAPAWQRDSARNGVAFHLANPEAGPDHSHNEWMKEKLATGWQWGSVKDSMNKEHPCIVPYDKLPPEQKAKDYIFRAIVHAFR